MNFVQIILSQSFLEFYQALNSRDSFIRDIFTIVANTLVNHQLDMGQTIENIRVQKWPSASNLNTTFHKYT